MTAWQEFSRADFDVRLAPKYIRQASEAGQEPLFTTGTPERERKQQQADQLPGQGAMFGADEEE